MVRRGGRSLPGLRKKNKKNTTILDILKLITDQRAAAQVAIKAIILVGGFGQSTYLRERLEAYTGGNIPVLQPENAWTAVVEGAVMKDPAKVNPERAAVMKVVDRKARKHYGFEFSVAYNHPVHAQLDHKKRWDGYNARWEAEVMQWFIKRVLYAAWTICSRVFNSIVPEFTDILDRATL